MAILSTADRQEIYKELQSEYSQERKSITCLKSELTAAIDAADQWVSDNAASYNSALPSAARTALTSSQKSQLLTHVITKRYVKGA